MIGYLVSSIAPSTKAPTNLADARTEAAARFGEFAWAWEDRDLAGRWCVVGVSCGGMRHELGRSRSGWASAFAAAEAAWKETIQ